LLNASVTHWSIRGLVGTRRTGQTLLQTAPARGHSHLLGLARQRHV